MVRSRRLLALSAFVILLIGVVPAIAAPPPEPVCQQCTAAYTDAGNASGVDVRVVESAAVIRLHENGSATWLVGLALTGPDAERVQANESLHRGIAQGATGEQFVGTGRGSLTTVAAEPLDVGGEGSAVSYRFHDDDFAQQGVGGTLVSTRFREDLTVANYNGLGVDRLTVDAPGMQLTRAPPSASTVSGLSGSSFTLTQVDETVVTFHPEQAGNSLHLLWLSLLGALSVAELLLPIVANNVVLLLVPALVPYALVLGVVLGAMGRLDLPAPPESARTAVTAVFGIAAVGGLFQPFYASTVALPVVGNEPSAIPVGLGAAAAVLAVGLRRQQRIRTVLSDSFVPSAIGAAETLAISATIVGGVAGAAAGAALPTTTAWDGLGLALTVVAPASAFLPATAATLDGRLGRGLATVVVGFLLGGLAAPVLYRQPTGVIFSGIFLAPFATGALLAVGWPCFLAGWVLAGEEPTTASQGQS